MPGPVAGLSELEKDKVRNSPIRRIILNDSSEEKEIDLQVIIKSKEDTKKAKARGRNKQWSGRVLIQDIEDRDSPFLTDQGPHHICGCSFGTRLPGRGLSRVFHAIHGCRTWSDQYIWALECAPLDRIDTDSPRLVNRDIEIYLDILNKYIYKMESYGVGLALLSQHHLSLHHSFYTFDSLTLKLLMSQPYN